MTPRKKLLFLITKSNFGGAQRYVYDLATHLPHDEYNIAVAFGSDGTSRAGRLSRLLIDKEVRTIMIPELARDVSPLLDLKAFHAILGMLRDEKPDIVHLNSSKAAALGALAARFAGVPRIVFTIHGLPSGEDRGAIARFFILLVTWFTIVCSHRTICVSESDLRSVQKLPFTLSKCVLIENGIEEPAFLTKEDARAALTSFDATILGATLIGMIAELHHNKNIPLAIDALADIPDAHLVIIGDGELREALRTYAATTPAKGRIHFLGTRDTAAQYLRAFDAFLLTSRKEGLPYVLLEAGAAGVPIIATDIESVRTLLAGDGAIADHSPHALAEVLTKTLAATEVSHAHAQKFQTRVREHFTLARMCTETERAYR